MTGIARNYSIDELKQKMLKKYENTHGGYGDRELKMTKYEHHHHFFLQGSPPKGYAIYIPANRTLLIYDATGKRYADWYMDKGLGDYLGK